jgi:hypothetical protein
MYRLVALLLLATSIGLTGCKPCVNTEKEKAGNQGCL